MSHDDNRPTVQVSTSMQERTGRCTITMSLPEIRVMQLCYPHGYTGNMVEEEVVAMKATLDQKFYGDARSHLNIMRYEIHDLSEGHARASLLALVENIENALSLRANLDLTEL